MIDQGKITPIRTLMGKLQGASFREQYAIISVLAFMFDALEANDDVAKAFTEHYGTLGVEGVRELMNNVEWV